MNCLTCILKIWVALLMFFKVTSGAVTTRKGSNQGIGERCTMGSSRPISGVCKLLEECGSAISNYRAGVPPTLCSSLTQDSAIVCCPTENRISAQKCTEYAKVLKQKVHAVPLLPVNFLPVQSNFKNDEISCEITPNALIANGRNSKINEFPFAVSLGYGERSQNKWLCAGVLISDEFILTAAHCVQTRFGFPKRALLGTIYLTHPSNISRKVLAPISQTVVHPEYKQPLKYNDIALLRLEKKLSLSKSVLPACLPQPAERVELKKAVQVTGWGLLESGIPSTILQVADLERLGQRACVSQFAENFARSIYFPQGILRSQLCAGHKERDSCQGDSGGPLTAKNEKLCLDYVVGITSFGSIPCGQGDPGVYTNVQSYLDWIENIVWPYSEKQG